ncbi:MAG TPA: hypothetical protein VK899_06455 [Gemmatimonadales bacterium]|nr:hypothetical protein [Gemmatimonadales bacterium]
MPLPDKHANEPTRDLNPDLWKRYQDAVDAMKRWEAEANRLQAMLLQELGDAYAGVVNGQKVVSHRPKDQVAWKRLRDDYPDLVPHFMMWKTEQKFDEGRFTEAHPEIVEQYRVRAFTMLGERKV